MVLKERKRKKSCYLKIYQKTEYDMYMQMKIHIQTNDDKYKHSKY